MILIYPLTPLPPYSTARVPALNSRYRQLFFFKKTENIGVWFIPTVLKDEGVNVKMPKKNHSYKTYDLHYLSVTTAALLLDPILADPTFIGIIPIRPTFSKARVICKTLSGMSRLF